MKKNTLIILLVAAILLIGGAVYLFEKNELPFFVQNTEQSKLVNGDFEMILPAGWAQVEETMGALAMAKKPEEKIDDPAAEKIGFKSYLAVSYDVLDGRDLSGYMQDVKNELPHFVPDTTFGEEKDMSVDGQPAKTLEVDMEKDGAALRSLIVAVEGKNKDIWTISFSTTKSNWDKYEKSFLDAVDTFKLLKE
ncbi:MAG: PsbP-related protein [Candidatus Pacebacteria bacterium]|nr:PsbP-related protein [Candidatus Paceibacterota bacterium]